MRSMTIDDTPQIIESMLSEEDLVKIREEYTILVLIGLELSGPSDRITTMLMTQVALYEEAFRVRLRLLLPGIVAKLLWWYQVYPT